MGNLTPYADTCMFGANMNRPLPPVAPEDRGNRHERRAYKARHRGR